MTTALAEMGRHGEALDTAEEVVRLLAKQKRGNLNANELRIKAQNRFKATSLPVLGSQKLCFLQLLLLVVQNQHQRRHFFQF